MKLWAHYLAWFGALQPRERNIVALAILLGGLFLGYTYGIEPNLQKARRDVRATEDATAAAGQMALQLAALNGLNKDPDAPLRAQLTTLKGEVAAQGGRFAAVERSMVSPAAMPVLLESFLGRASALKLVSLRTLAPTPLIERKPPADAKDKLLQTVGAQTEAAALDVAGAPNLFKHGVELTLEGNYSELLAYVQALENAPQRLLWGKMNLTALEYPRSQLVLTVYTLSLETSWLVL
jgi:MSHA biogenesis protein MshJ